MSCGFSHVTSAVEEMPPWEAGRWNTLAVADREAEELCHVLGVWHTPSRLWWALGEGAEVLR